tara:strand:+ start:3838 stop:4293 length:456 start_codon:yes stop_codon:yes gene_type:complete
MSGQRRLVFGFLFASIIASAVLQFVVYSDLDSCPKIEFPLLSFIFICLSFIPPMFYRVKRMRSLIVMTHIATSLCGTLFSGAVLAELYHIEAICGKNGDHQFNMQLAVVILFNLATIAGHFMGSSDQKKSTQSNIQQQETTNLLRKIPPSV